MSLGLYKILYKICKSINVNFEDKLKTLTCLPRPYDIYTLVNRFFDHGLIFCRRSELCI